MPLLCASYGAPTGLALTPRSGRRGRVTTPDEAKIATHIRVINSVSIRQGDHPQIPQLIPGLLEGRVTLIAGAAGAGKTTICEQIARHLSSHHQLGRFPLPEAPIGAWLMYLEDDASLAQDRSLRVASIGTLAEDEDGTSKVDYLMGRGWSLEKLAAMLQAAREAGTLPGVIFLDHLRILIGSQPSGISPNDWERRNLLRLVDLAEEYGVHIVVLTHLNKMGGISGTTELIACVDAAYVIEPKDDRAYATLKCYKMRVAPETDYALSRKANGTWAFDDEVYVSETMADGIALDILTVLRAEGRKTLADLCMHHAVPGTRRGIQQALTRARRRGWVINRHGHWEIRATDGDTLLRPDPDAPQPGPITDVRLPDPAPAREPEPEPASQPAPAPARRWDPDAESDTREEGFSGMKALKASIAASRMHPVPYIRPEERDQDPWPRITDDVGGEPRARDWARPGWSVSVRKDPQGGKRTTVIKAPEGMPPGRLITLDRNGSYPSACSSVPLAPNRLLHTGPLDAYDRSQAGIYLIRLPQWREETTPHPLGAMAYRGDDQVIVSTPHMRLLTALARQQRMEPPSILDSWTGRANQSLFEGFYKQARAARVLLVDGDPEAYAQYKTSVSKALRVLWPDKARSPFWRPDWRVSLVAEASVRHWISADKAVQRGATLVTLKSTDEAVFYLAGDATGVPEPYELGKMFGQVKEK